MVPLINLYHYFCTLCHSVTWEFNFIDHYFIFTALTRIQGELANNAGKLTEIDAHITREQKKLAEIEASPDLQVHEERVKAKIT